MEQAEKKGGTPLEPGVDPDVPYLEFRLYVVDGRASSTIALARLKALSERHFPGRYRIEVVDVLEKPGLARADHIVAMPTLVRLIPHSGKRLVGTLDDERKVLSWMMGDAS